MDTPRILSGRAGQWTLALAIALGVLWACRAQSATDAAPRAVAARATR